MGKINTYGVNSKDEYGFTLGEFLIKEMGAYFADIIELEFDMTVGEFCKEFIEIDEKGGFWVCTI